MFPAANFADALMLAHKNQRNSGTDGPSRKRCVGTSAAVVLVPALRFLRMLSNTMNPPKRPAMRHPQAPKQAVVIRAVGYLGFSLSRKMLLDTRPIRFANGTPTDVRTTLRPSEAMLLLYQVDKRTDGAEVPQTIMKHA
jgi:hypothetical protein